MTLDATMTRPGAEPSTGEAPVPNDEVQRLPAASRADRMLETVDRDAPVAVPDELSLAGARFGRYTVLDEIGRGAMATVYTAYDDQLDRKIAIKLIRDPDIHVQSEAQAVARVSHPNVVQIYEIGTFQGHDFIAMELVDGINLSSWQRLHSRDVYDIIAMYAQAGRGLAAIHRAGLVHRDFKPDNVLIDNNGRARIGDFGLAVPRHLRDSLEHSTTLASADDLATRDDTIVGTPAYMAPEQFRSPDVDARADQFSLCAALYEAVYGVRPLRGSTLPELRASALAGVLQDPPPGAPDLPTLRALLRRGLAIDPARRWPFLSDLLDQLDLLDARRDPAAAARERRRLVLGLFGGTALVFGAQFALRVGRTPGIPVDIMIVISTLLLVILSIVVYLARFALLRNNYHLRMISLIFSVSIGCYIVTPLATLNAGLSVEDILLVQMLALGQCSLVAAPFISWVLLLNCAIPWACAAAMAFGAPALPMNTLGASIGLTVLALCWAYPPSTRHALSLIADVPAIRSAL